MATGDPIAPTIPMVVLVDHYTASSSEIVTAALQDHHRATVVGTHTYGKGVFQEDEPLSNGGALEITVGEYFTPDGRNLGGSGVNQGAGIAPEVPLADSVSTPPRVSTRRSARSPRRSSEPPGDERDEAGWQVREVAELRRAPVASGTRISGDGGRWAREHAAGSGRRAGLSPGAPTAPGDGPARRDASRSAPIASPIAAGRRARRGPGARWAGRAGSRTGADHARARPPRRRARRDRGLDARPRSRAPLRRRGA